MISFENKVVLYIGADNQTGIVNTEKLELVLDSEFDGYTIVESIGHWQGTKENSVIVTIFTDWNREKVDSLVKELRGAMNQYSILVECSGARYLIERE
jgi:hypothetical protein